VGRTFAAVFDTSGSLEHVVLGYALGAIASYAAARVVGLVRVIFCDAAAHDGGYMSPETIAGRVRVMGRGGTILQPGLDRLEEVRDFPKKAPVLIVTDGACDAFTTRRDHAVLLPAGARLPMSPRGPVFRIR
jgi:predicted metal-dependent peptidase